jgi:hypothetical protein
MAKGKRQKDKHYNGRFPLAIILFVLLSFSFGHYIVCPFVVFIWPLYCLSRQKDKQYNGHRKNEKRTNNIMVKGKRQKANECRFPLAIILFVLLSFSFDHYIFCPFLVFPLTIILFVLVSFSFDHYIDC